MNVPVFLLILGGGVAAMFLLEAFVRWWVRRGFERGLQRRFNSADLPSSGPSAASPESGFVVHLSETGICCERPDGRTEQVTWDDLQRVELLTTDEGPFAPDVFWVLSGPGTGCLIPQGATGEKALLPRLGQLPGFDHEAVIRAMGSTENARFLCWQRTSENPTFPTHDDDHARRATPPL